MIGFSNTVGKNRITKQPTEHRYESNKADSVKI